MIIKEVLLNYEVEHDKSHLEMAEMFGVSLSTYYRWITGESTRIQKSKVQKISSIIGIDMDEVIEETMRSKPILGTVKAGYDLWAEENIEGYIELGDADSKRGDYFLRVKGDSMEGSHIYEGDLVFVEQTNCVESGQIAIVLIDNEVTIKTVHYQNNLMILEASNSKYKPRVFTPEEIELLGVKIIGKVRFIRTDVA